MEKKFKNKGPVALTVIKRKGNMVVVSKKEALKNGETSCLKPVIKLIKD